MNTLTFFKSRLDVFAAELYYLRRGAEIRLEARRERLERAARRLDGRGPRARDAWNRIALRGLRGGDRSRPRKTGTWTALVTRILSMPGSPFWFMGPRRLDGYPASPGDCLRLNQAAGGTLRVCLLGLGLWVYRARSFLKWERRWERFEYRDLAVRMAGVLLYEEARGVQRALRYRAETEILF